MPKLQEKVSLLEKITDKRLLSSILVYYADYCKCSSTSLYKRSSRSRPQGHSSPTRPPYKVTLQSVSHSLPLVFMYLLLPCDHEYEGFANHTDAECQLCNANNLVWKRGTNLRRLTMFVGFSSLTFYISANERSVYFYDDKKLHGTSRILCKKWCKSTYLNEGWTNAAEKVNAAMLRSQRSRTKIHQYMFNA